MAPRCRSNRPKVTARRSQHPRTRFTQKCHCKYAVVLAVGLCTTFALCSDSRFELQSTGRMLRAEEHTSELQSRENLVCRLLLEKKKKRNRSRTATRQ